MNKREKMLSNAGLRNLEVFYIDASEAKARRAEAQHEGVRRDELQMVRAGFYYWFSLPGCLPDSDAFGPYRTELAAIRDAFRTFGTWE